MGRLGRDQIQVWGVKLRCSDTKGKEGKVSPFILKKRKGCELSFMQGTIIRIPKKKRKGKGRVFKKATDEQSKKKRQSPSADRVQHPNFQTNDTSQTSVKKSTQKHTDAP